MKRNWIKYGQKHRVWLLLLLGMDLLFALVLWLADARAFQALWGLMALGSAGLFAAVSWYLCREEERREQAFLRFLECPDLPHEVEVTRLVSGQEGELVRAVGNVLREHQRAQEELRTQINDYEDYVEVWAHEIKTPLSLLTFLLDNRREELPPAVCRRLDYIRSQIQEEVGQMLYYARLKAAQKDYLFEPLSLSLCCEELLADNRAMLEERGFEIQREIPALSVLSDRRGLAFLLNQIISNAIKYARTDGTPVLRLAAEREEDSAIVLRIQDNGIGVRECDLPFLFEKGFTGDTGAARKKATGMGLYLAREMARDLNIELEARGKWQQGFEMSLRFPIVEEGQGNLIPPLERL